MDHDHSSPGIESQGHRSRLRVRVNINVCYTSVYCGVL